MDCRTHNLGHVVKHQERNMPEFDSVDSATNLWGHDQASIKGTLIQLDNLWECDMHAMIASAHGIVFCTMHHPPGTLDEAWHEGP